jgi:Kef-type K+ transport system membrane component KefB
MCLAARQTGAFAAISLAESANVASLAELGVVFLLFLIGLELSFERLMTMRRLVFGLGSLQVCITLAAVSAVLYLLGFGLELSLILGAAFSLSSTAIVVQLLSYTKRLGSQTGRTSFAILLFQDLAVIPLLLWSPSGARCRRSGPTGMPRRWPGGRHRRIVVYRPSGPERMVTAHIPTCHGGTL